MASPFASELYCNIDTGFYDVFEPTYIRSALAKDCNLGHLVFGNEAGVVAGPICRAVPKD